MNIYLYSSILGFQNFQFDQKMKASIKFRDDRKPLFRAKIPLNIIGIPFLSGIVAGESKELALNLSTFFDSGPSIKLTYRPNDASDPFSLGFRTGIGHFGSPISSSMTMSAEFNLVGSQNPRFLVHFKPQFGDFRIKKSQSSVFVKKLDSKSNVVAHDDDESIEVVESPAVKSGYFPENGLFSGGKINVFPQVSPASGVLESVFSGMEMSARTVLPVRSRAVVNFRWGVKFPSEEDAAARTSLRRLPFLVMNKIGIEHLTKYSSDADTKSELGSTSPENTNISETFLNLKKQLELIQTDNELLRKSMVELRSEISAGKSDPSADLLKYKETGERKVDRRSNGDKRSPDGKVPAVATVA